VGPLLHVPGRELPVLLRLVDALEEAPLLLVARDVQEELADQHAVARQVAFECADVLVAVVPDILAEKLRWQLLGGQVFGVHLHGEHLLVVTAIEDADAPALGQVPQAAPQVVMVELFRARRLVRVHLAALRIDARHHVLDRSVLPRSVHGLEHQQDRPAILRVEHVLQFGERLDADGQALDSLRLVLRTQLAGVGRVDILEPEAAAVRDPVRTRDLPCRLDHAVEIKLVVGHARS
jgi:hypothetical protein